MLTACATSADRIEPASVPADPVIETRREVVTTCPAELLNAPAQRPQPAADAVVEYNPAGGAWLAQLIAWGEGAVQALTDARAQCPKPETARG
ncbi:hypothetical protein [Brevundimonas sp.]|uniref:hypothetical protein n=1 Tax=Brevundimonas sp. TaxID=1871086 RepID=UPI003D6D2407